MATAFGNLASQCKNICKQGYVQKSTSHHWSNGQRDYKKPCSVTDIPKLLSPSRFSTGQITVDFLLAKKRKCLYYCSDYSRLLEKLRCTQKKNFQIAKWLQDVRKTDHLNHLFSWFLSGLGNFFCSALQMITIFIKCVIILFLAIKLLMACITSCFKSAANSTVEQQLYSKPR